MSSVKSLDNRDAPIALVDLGDTLCDCTPALREGLARLRGQGESAHEEDLVPLPAHLESRRRKVMERAGFWRALPPRALGFEILALLQRSGFRVYVLTKGPRDAPHVWAEKVAWCRAHLPGVPVIVTDDKAVVYGSVLVDDWLPYIQHWQRRWRTGRVIVPAQPWNAQVLAEPGYVRYDGSNGEEVVALLKGVVAAKRVEP